MKALVTAGTRGIGAAIAADLKTNGWQVFTFSREGGDVQADVLVPGDIERVQKACGPVDALINNVGGGGRWGPPESELAGEAVWYDVWLKNVMAMAKFTSWALPHMMERGFGRVVTISSIHGKEAGGRPWFAAAKAAEIAAMKAYSQDKSFARRGITFNTICPGNVLVEGKPAISLDNLPMGRMGMPQDVAKMVSFLCSPNAAWISGSCITIDGGESRAF